MCVLYVCIISNTSKNPINIYNHVLLYMMKMKKHLKLLKKLKEVISDDVKISEIVKSFDADDVFNINKHFPKINEPIIKRYGINNMQVSVKDYKDRSYYSNTE